MKLNLLFATAVIPLASCSPEPPEPAAGETITKKLSVFADSYPVAYFARIILGDTADVDCPVPDGKDPITWFPDDNTLLQIQGADFVLLNGANFTKWPEKVSLPDSKVIDTAAVFSDEFIRYENALSHTHGDSEHTHEGIDGHTWMAPKYMRLQAEAIYAGIEKAGAEDSKASYSKLSDIIDGLDARYQEVTSLLGQKPLLASHPAYNYVAAQYDWNIVNLDLDPDAPLDSETLETIRVAHSSHPAAILLWESAPLPETAQNLETELGLRSVVFSPCETAPETDFADVIQTNLDALKNALE